MYSLNQTTNFILEQEASLGLFKLLINDTYIWPLIRYNLLIELNMLTGVTGRPHDPVRKWNRKERYQKALKYDPLAFKVPHHADTLIIQHPRKVLVDNKAVDIYTKDVVASYPHHLILNRQDENNLGLKNNGVILLQESVFDKYNKKIQNRLVDLPSFYEFEILSEAIKREFKVDLDVSKFFQDKYKHFVAGEERMIRFLQKNKIKQVVLVVSYANYDVISACRKCGVKVIECQHGTISKYHLGYHYPNGCPQACFPDEFLMFAPYWRLSAAIPLKDEQIKYIGFKYFHDEAQKYVVDRQNSVLTVLSQGTCGDIFVEQVLAFAKAYPMMTINYKLHPGEFTRVEERYPALKEAPSNVHVYKNERPLYEMLKESKYVVGASSTAIFEALALGCIGILIDVAGARDHMEPLIQNDLVYITNNLSKDFAFIANDAKKDVKNIYF